MPPSHGLCRLPSRASLPSVESRFIVRAARGEEDAERSTERSPVYPLGAAEVGCIYAPVCV